MREGPARRVVVTGIGMVTPLGHDLESSWAGLMAGKSGTGPITHWDATDFPTQITARGQRLGAARLHGPQRRAAHEPRHAAGVEGDTGGAGTAPGWTSHRRTARASAWRWGWPSAAGILLRRRAASWRENGPKRFNPASATAALISSAPTFIAIKHGITGPTNSQVTACATGITSIGEAARRLQRGEADVMLTGGAEGYLTKMAISTFSRLGAASTRNDEPESACRPFSGDRDGMVVGEGAGAFVLETLEHAQRARRADPRRVRRLRAE